MQRPEIVSVPPLHALTAKGHPEKCATRLEKTRPAPGESGQSGAESLAASSLRTAAHILNVVHGAQSVTCVPLRSRKMGAQRYSRAVISLTCVPERSR